MPNQFVETEIVLFEKTVEKFENSYVATGLARKVNFTAKDLARSGFTINRKMPVIMNSYSGIDQTSNFTSVAALSVPGSVDIKRSVPWEMTAEDLMDPTRVEDLSTGASQILAADVDLAILEEARDLSSMVLTKAGAATGFDDVVAARVMFNRLGVTGLPRKFMLSSDDYQNMAKNLAERQTVSGKVETAYERAFVGRIAQFDTYELETAVRLTATTAATVSINGSNQYYVPTPNASGSRLLVDPRFQQVNMTVGSGALKRGDKFKMATVLEVNHINKVSTGLPKTFSVVDVTNGGAGDCVVTITPPIISAQGGTRPELQYKNVTATPADNAVVTMMNIADAYANIAFQENAIEVYPANYILPEEGGWATREMTTDSGITIRFTKFTQGNDLSVRYRYDLFFGTNVINTEMSAVSLFSQT